MRILIVVILTVLVGNSFGQFEKISEEVFDLIDNDKEAKAFKLLDGYMEDNPDSDSLHYIKGMAYYTLGDGKQAFQSLSKAINITPDYFDAYIMRGHLCMDLHLFEEAKLDYDYALTLADSDTTVARSKKGLASYFLYNRDFKKSVELLEEVLAVYPDDIVSLNNIAIALEDIDRKDEAIEYLIRVAEVDSLFIPAYINLGFQLSHVERYEEALFYFDKAAEINDQEPLLLSNRGFVYYKLGEYKKALADLNLSLKIHAQNSYGYKNRALILLALEEKEKACEDLYTARAYGYEKMYGDKVKELIDKNCIK